MPHRTTIVTGHGRPARRRVQRLFETGYNKFRPILLAALAAGAFAVLLRWQHGKFERDMVSNFQHYQFQTANTISDSIQRAFSEVTKNLRLSSSYPETQSLSKRSLQIVQAGYETYQDVSRSVFVADANGQVLYCAPLGKRPDTTTWPALAKTFPSQDNGEEAWYAQDPNGELIQILVPIRSNGKLKGVVGCEVILPNLLAQCLARSDDAKRNKCWVVGPGGQVIYRGGGHISADDVDALSLEAQVKAMTANNCVRRGLTDVMEVSTAGQGGLIVTCTPFILGDSRYALAIGASKSGISVPLNSHERVIYALIALLAMLYFATGYLSYRSEKAHAELAEQRRRAAEAASKAKTEFLARMSHEIRTPMHGVLGMTELVLESDLTAQQRRCLDLAKRSADSLLTVINDILDISKIEAGKFKLTVVPFNLRDCMKDTIEPFIPRARTEGIELSLEMDPAVPAMVIGDPGRLRQIVTNLVGNAMKFTRQGSVTVRIRRAEEFVDSVRLKFEVCDTGVGIAPEKQAAIFDAFEQADGSTSRKYGGTGLGLAISAQLVEMMSGKLGVESEQGGGSRFYFDIKLGLMDPNTAKGSAPMKGMKGMRVLVVDMDEANGVRLSHLLETWQMKPVHVRSGVLAVAELEQARLRGDFYQLVILDAVLGDMEGFELARRIRRMSGGSDIAMLMCASGIRGDSERCREVNIRGYLSKPVDPASLLRAVAACFADSAGRRLITRHWLRENFRRLRILLTDDNEVNIEHGKMLLEKWGHEICCANNGRQALEQLAERPFDLILMDLQMPEMDGLEATRAIRQAEQGTGRHIPIIAMTADAMAEARDKCIEAGMDAYVSKPVQTEALLATIEEVSRRHIQALDVSKLEGSIESVTKATESRGTSSEAGADSDSGADVEAGPAGQSRPVNMEKAMEFADGSRATLERLSKLFADGLPGMRADLHIALDAHAADMLRKASHRLRGSAALFGADAVVLGTERLSDAAKEADWPKAVETLAELDSELDRVRSALKAFCGIPADG